MANLAAGLRFATSISTSIQRAPVGLRSVQGAPPPPSASSALCRGLADSPAFAIAMRIGRQIEQDSSRMNGVRSTASGPVSSV